MSSAANHRAARRRAVLFTLGALISPALLALDNADFSELRVEYADRQALPGWVPVLTGDESRSDARVVVEAVDFAYDGEAGPGGTRGNVAYFDTLTDGFGTNKLDQCVEFDATQPLDITFPLRTNAPISNHLRVRVNPVFYADRMDCEADIQEDHTDNKLQGGDFADLDWDMRFGNANATSNEWVEFYSTDGNKEGEISYAAHSAPMGATVVRISLRARDDSATPERRIYFGPVELTNGESPSKLQNGDFSVAMVAEDQRVVQDDSDSGWIADSGTLFIESTDFAASSPNVLVFTNLVSGFGDTRLDQCVALVEGRDLGVALQVRSSEPHSELKMRIDVQPMADADCDTDAGNNIRHDFSVDGPADTWQWLETPATAWEELDSSATHARVSVRARDRSDDGGPSMDPVRTIYVDQVFLQSMIELTVPPGTYDAAQHVGIVEIPAGLTARYTLDGSTPGANSPILTDAVRLAYNGDIVLSVRLFDAVGNPASGVSQARYTLDIAGAPTFTGLDTTALSGVVGDPTDPAATSGLAFSVVGNGSLTVSAASSNPSVVPDSSLQVTGSGSDRTLIIQPVDVGYATITLTVTDGDDLQAMHTIQYAASAHPDPDITQTRWYTGRADLSAAVSLDEDFIMVFDDEGDYERLSPLANGVLVYDLSASGAPVADLSEWVDDELDVANSDNCELDDLTGVYLDECSTDGEIDYEAAMRVDDRIYVTGSHSNNRNGRARPDRWRFFAADLSGSGAATDLDVKGYYQWLREDLRAWDQTNGHGYGADHFGLVFSSNSGVAETDPDLNQAPESPNLNGFSIEGLTLSPDDSAAWFGFRAPLVAGPDGPAVLNNNSAAGRTHALIVAVTNYDDLATAADGGSIGMAEFSAPIRLDLGGRGIREMRRDGQGHYLIIAGPPDSATGTAPRDFRLFTWDGSHVGGFATNLVEREESLASFTQPNFAGSPEGIAVLPDDLLAGGEIEIVSDNGDVDFYASGTAAKELAYNAHKKFRIDRVVLAATGRCGANAGSDLASAPEVDALCASGTPGVLYGGAHGPWRWSCESERPELGTAFCEAMPTLPPPAGSAPPVPPSTDWDSLSDSYGSGVPDYVQSLVLSANGETLGDGNGDGTPDYLQGHVVSLPGANGSYVTLVSGGEHLLQGVRTMTSPPSGLPSPGAGVALPFGLIGFDVTGLDMGGSDTIAVHLPFERRINAWLKWNYESERWEDVSQNITHQGSQTIVTFSLTDGDAYDVDRLANGIIQDPGGPAILGGGAAAGSARPIPVMAPWMMPVLALLMLLAGLRARRHAPRQHAPRHRVH